MGQADQPNDELSIHVAKCETLTLSLATSNIGFLITYGKAGGQPYETPRYATRSGDR